MTDLVFDDETQPPMENGEVVFDEPWQSRTFGMASSLCEQGVFTWDEFREELIRHIDVWESGASGENYRYWDHFLSALTSVVDAKAVVSDVELLERSEQFARRPHDHDHDH